MPEVLPKWAEVKINSLEETKASVTFVQNEVNHAYDRLEDHLTKIEDRLSDKIYGVSEQIDFRMTHMSSSIQDIKEGRVEDRKETIERLNALSHCRKKEVLNKIQNKQDLYEKSVGNIYKWFIGLLVPVMAGVITFVYLTMARANEIEQSVIQNKTVIKEIKSNQKDKDKDIENLLKKIKDALKNK